MTDHMKRFEGVGCEQAAFNWADEALKAQAQAAKLQRTLDAVLEWIDKYVGEEASAMASYDLGKILEG